MRWKSKVVNLPVNGDIRERDVFLMWPTFIGGEWVWLETVLCIEQFYSGYTGSGWYRMSYQKKEIHE